MRVIHMSPRRGLEANEVIVPEADSGTKASRFLATGLIQPAEMRLATTHGFPEASVNGCPVSGSVGFCKGLPRPVKSPLRSADEGTNASTDVASRWSRKPW